MMKMRRLIALTTAAILALSTFAMAEAVTEADTEAEVVAVEREGGNIVYTLASDRGGAVVYNGIEGETVNYNGTDYTYYGMGNVEVTQNDDGTVDYKITIRDDQKFSDGEPVTIDDYIFSFYVFADPTYDGSTTLYALPIEGMEEYRSGMQSKLDLLLATGKEGYEENEYFTEDEYNSFWEAFDKAGEAFSQEIVDYCKAAGYNEESDSVAACAANWGFELAEDATAADFFASIVDAYDLHDRFPHRADRRRGCDAGAAERYRDRIRRCKCLRPDPHR